MQANTQGFIVCQTNEDGILELSTRQVYPTRLLAENYARTLAPNLNPTVVTGRFGDLRMDDTAAATQRQPEAAGQT